MVPAAFKTIWRHPRRTVRARIEEDARYLVLPLVCVAGVGDVLSNASARDAGDTMSLPLILGLAILGGPLGGVIGLWISTHLLHWTGTWLGGRATHEHIRTALAWAQVPSIAGLAIWAVLIPAFGIEMFTREMPVLEQNPLALGCMTALTSALAVLSFYSLAILCCTVAEVQGYRSVWRGLANLLLSGAVVVVPILLVALVIALFGSLGG